MLIFNFHGIGPIRRALADGEREYWLDIPAFEAALDAVQTSPGVRLTFDDGNASDFELVLSSLLRRNLRATFFVCSGRIDQESFLTAAQIRELTQHGMTIGSHGINHVNWRTLSPAARREEMTVSRAALEAAAGCSVDQAACPFGEYDRRVLQALREAGYKAAYTSDGGVACDNVWLRPRNTITREMMASDVCRVIATAPQPWWQATTRVRMALKRLR